MAYQCPLLVDELRDAVVRQVEQRQQRVSPERDGLGGALYLDEASIPGLDDVHVDVGAAVVLVRQIEERFAVNDADADRRDVIGQRDGPDRVPLAKLLEVWRLEREKWLRLGSWRGNARVRAEPFEAFELELAALWAE